MRVLCLANRGTSLPPHLRHSVENDNTRFSPLKIGEEYGVYGLKFLSNRVDYLLYPMLHDPYWAIGPIWMPGPLFQVVDSALPPWGILLTENHPEYAPLFTNYGITAVIGYKELITSVDHFDGILDREFEHLERFFKEVMRIDRWRMRDE